MENIQKCIVCGQTNYKNLFEAKDRVYPKNNKIFIVRSCKNCGLKWLTPQPSLEYLKKYAYPDNYGPYKIKTKIDNYYKQLFKKTFIFKLLNKFLDTHATWLPKLCKGAKVLEMGCSNGEYLKNLEKYEWDLYGIDMAKASIEYAKKLNLNVSCSTLENIKFPDNYFDLIFGWHIIEHLKNPLNTIKKIF